MSYPINSLRTGRRPHSDGLLLIITAGLAFFYLTRLVNTALQWSFLVRVYPHFVPVYFLLSGAVFSLTLLTLTYGMWRGYNWIWQTARIVFICWSISALAEGAYTYSLGWRSGWEMNLILWLAASSLIFWRLRRGYGRPGKARSKGVKIHDIQSGR